MLGMYSSALHQLLCHSPSNQLWPGCYVRLWLFLTPEFLGDYATNRISCAFNSIYGKGCSGRWPFTYRAHIEVIQYQCRIAGFCSDSMAWSHTGWGRFQHCAPNAWADTGWSSGYPGVHWEITGCCKKHHGECKCAHTPSIVVGQMLVQTIAIPSGETL